MEVKELKARGNASTKADEAKGKLDNFNNTKTPTKTFLATGNASKFTDTAQGKLNLFNGTGIPTKIYRQMVMQVHLQIVQETLFKDITIQVYQQNELM